MNPFHDNEGLEHLVKDYSDSDLLRTRVSLIRQLGRLSDFLAIVDGERVARAPQDQEAVVIPLPRVSDGLVREEI